MNRTRFHHAHRQGYPRSFATRPIGTNNRLGWACAGHGGLA